ncbi:MAG: hypothetical protein WA021_00130 [Minisyncoccia bacterium]
MTGAIGRASFLIIGLLFIPVFADAQASATAVLDSANDVCIQWFARYQAAERAYQAGTRPSPPYNPLQLQDCRVTFQCGDTTGTVEGTCSTREPACFGLQATCDGQREGLSTPRPEIYDVATPPPATDPNPSELPPSRPILSTGNILEAINGSETGSGSGTSGSSGTGGQSLLQQMFGEGLYTDTTNLPGMPDTSGLNGVRVGVLEGTVDNSGGNSSNSGSNSSGGSGGSGHPTGGSTFTDNYVPEWFPGSGGSGGGGGPSGLGELLRGLGGGGGTGQNPRQNLNNWQIPVAPAGAYPIPGQPSGVPPSPTALTPGSPPPAQQNNNPPPLNPPATPPVNPQNNNPGGTPQGENPVPPAQPAATNPLAQPGEGISQQGGSQQGTQGGTGNTANGSQNGSQQGSSGGSNNSGGSGTSGQEGGTGTEGRRGVQLAGRYTNGPFGLGDPECGDEACVIPVYGNGAGSGNGGGGSSNGTADNNSGSVDGNPTGNQGNSLLGYVGYVYNQLFGGTANAATPPPQQGRRQPTGNSPYLARQRVPLVAELDGDPALRDLVAWIIANELGGGGAGSQAVLESLLNRAAMRNTSIRTQIFNGFYGPVNRALASGRAMTPTPNDRAVADRMIALVRAGSNICNYCTDQGMRNEIVGPAEYIGGEWFGHMSGNPRWANQQRALETRFNQNVAQGGPGVGTEIPPPQVEVPTRSVVDRARAMGLGNPPPPDAREIALLPGDGIQVGNPTGTGNGNAVAATPPPANPTPPPPPPAVTPPRNPPAAANLPANPPATRSTGNAAGNVPANVQVAARTLQRYADRLAPMINNFYTNRPTEFTPEQERIIDMAVRAYSSNRDALINARNSTSGSTLVHLNAIIAAGDTIQNYRGSLNPSTLNRLEAQIRPQINALQASVRSLAITGTVSSGAGTASAASRASNEAAVQAAADAAARRLETTAAPPVPVDVQIRSSLVNIYVNAANQLDSAAETVRNVDTSQAGTTVASAVQQAASSIRNFFSGSSGGEQVSSGGGGGGEVSAQGQNGNQGTSLAAINQQIVNNANDLQAAVERNAPQEEINTILQRQDQAMLERANLNAQARPQNAGGNAGSNSGSASRPPLISSSFLPQAPAFLQPAAEALRDAIDWVRNAAVEVTNFEFAEGVAEPKSIERLTPEVSNVDMFDGIDISNTGNPPPASPPDPRQITGESVSATAIGELPPPDPRPDNRNAPDGPGRETPPPPQPSLFGLGGKNGTGWLSGLGALLQGYAIFNAQNQQYPPMTLAPVPAAPAQPGTPAPASQRPSIALAANPNSIAVGTSTRVTWTALRATQCQLQSGTTVIATGNPSGSWTSTALSQTTSFTIGCVGTAGTASATVTVYVGEAAPVATQLPQPAPTLTVSTGTGASVSSQLGGSQQQTWCDPQLPINAFISCLNSMPGSVNSVQ